MAGNYDYMVAKEGDYVEGELRQGDILVRNGQLRDAVAEAHQYYAIADGYDFFLVLTPTCELVKRNGRCSSRYITLAAIRPLLLVIGRQLEHYKKSIKAPGLYCQLDKRVQAEQFVMRLLHNTEDGYVFLPKELFKGEVEDDRCAFLKLSIALRSSHYQSCIDAKIQQLAIDLSAKVGLLAANLYGQIATEALEEQADVNVNEIIGDLKRRTLDQGDVFWLSRQRIKEFDKAVRAKGKALGRDLSLSEATSLIQDIPSDQKLLANRIGELMTSKGIADEHVRLEFVNLLAGDQRVAQFLK